MTTIYRHKFTPTFMTRLEEWVSVHKFDENEAFIDNWQLWCRSNELSIENERETLQKNGCKKNIYTKMYKTVRYYLKNKKEEKTEPKKRRPYISLDKDLIEDMDSHVEFSNKKPQQAYEDFLENSDFNKNINNTISELKYIGLNEDDIYFKIKKTYKNRCYIYKKLNNNKYKY